MTIRSVLWCQLDPLESHCGTTNDNHLNIVPSRFWLNLEFGKNLLNTFTPTLLELVT